MFEPKLFYIFTKFCQSLILNLWFVTLLCFLAKIANIAKSNCVFPGKKKIERALILKYLDSLMAEVFSHHCLSFSISVIFRGMQVVKVGPEVQTLGPSLFHKNSNPSNFFQTMFLFSRVLLTLVRISAILDHIWAGRGPKTSQKGWIGTQNFANF